MSIKKILIFCLLGITLVSFAFSVYLRDKWYHQNIKKCDKAFPKQEYSTTEKPIFLVSDLKNSGQLISYYHNVENKKITSISCKVFEIDKSKSAYILRYSDDSLLLYLACYSKRGIYNRRCIKGWGYSGCFHIIKNQDDVYDE